MDCPKCANGVAGSLKSLKGVKTADVSVEKGQAVVVYEDTEVRPDQLKKRNLLVQNTKDAATRQLAL